jgi:hypothetical protein
LLNLGGVLGVQVDLIVGALERESDSSLGWAAGQVVLKEDAYFLGRLFTFSPSMVLHRTVVVPAIVSNAAVRRFRRSALVGQAFPTASSTRVATLSYSC